jgi:ketosteroid isomerase-like protein
MNPALLRRLFAAVLSVILTMIASAAPAPGGDASVETRSRLDRFRHEFREALLQGDVASVLPRFAGDLRLMPEFQRTVLGTANAQAYWRAFAGRFAVAGYTRDVMEIIDLGQRLVEWGRFRQQLVSKAGGKEYELIGKYLDIWEKRDDQLVLITSAWNYDHQVDFADLLRFPEVPAVHVAFQPRAAVATQAGVDVAALGLLIERTVTSHDAPLFTMLYADDAVLLHNYHAALIGRQEIATFTAEHFKQLSVFEKLDIRNDRVDDLGDHVIEYGSHVASWRNGQWSGVNPGKNIRIWRRQADGALRIFRAIAMYD